MSRPKTVTREQAIKKQREYDRRPDIKARRSARAKAWRAANPEKARERNRIANQKQREKPGYKERMREYGKRRSATPERLAANARQMAKWRIDNRDHYQKYVAEWNAAHPGYQQDHYEKNKEHVAVKQKQWRENNIEKARVYYRNYASKKRTSGQLSVDIFDRLLKEQDGKCNYCYVHLSDVEPHIDHITPIFHGGANTDDNVQLLCYRCNAQKGAKHPLLNLIRIALLLGAGKFDRIGCRHVD